MEAETFDSRRFLITCKTSLKGGAAAVPHITRSVPDEQKLGNLRLQSIWAPMHMYCAAKTLLFRPVTMSLDVNKDSKMGFHFLLWTNQHLDGEIDWIEIVEVYMWWCDWFQCLGDVREEKWKRGNCRTKKGGGELWCTWHRFILFEGDVVPGHPGFTPKACITSPPLKIERKILKRHLVRGLRSDLTSLAWNLSG
jgi:hypothetical protein